MDEFAVEFGHCGGGGGGLMCEYINGRRSGIDSV